MSEISQAGAGAMQASMRSQLSVKMMKQNDDQQKQIAQMVQENVQRSDEAVKPRAGGKGQLVNKLV